MFLPLPFHLSSSLPPYHSLPPTASPHPLSSRLSQDHGNHEFDEKFAVELWLEEVHADAEVGFDDAEYKDEGGFDNDVDEHTDSEDNDHAAAAGAGGQATAAEGKDG